MPTSKKASPSRKSAQTAPSFNLIVILSPGEDMAAAEAELRLRTVSRFLKATVPPVLRIGDIGAGPESTALALYRTFRAVGRGGPALYLCAGNPTEGALSMLVTDWGNTILAPNDGTLGLLATLFNLRNIPHTLHHLDIEKVTDAERRRMQNPEWLASPDFLLRDLLAPAAAHLLPGIPAIRLAATATTRTTPGGLVLHKTPFAARLQPFPLRLQESITAHFLPTNPKGQGLLNLTLDPLSFDQLAEEHATYRLSYPSRCRWWPFPRTLTVTAHAPDHHTIGQHPHGAVCGHAHGCFHTSKNRTNHIHLSSLPAPTWDEHFISLHLGTPLSLPETITLTRVR